MFKSVVVANPLKSGPTEVVPSAIKYCDEVPPAFTKLLAVVVPLIVVLPFFKTTIASLLLFSSVPLPTTNMRSAPLNSYGEVGVFNVYAVLNCPRAISDNE